MSRTRTHSDSVDQSGEWCVPHVPQKVVRHKIAVVGPVLELEPDHGFARTRLADLERDRGGIVDWRRDVSVTERGRTGRDSPMPASWGFAAATPVVLNRDKNGL